jgi:hypothetical protein
MVGSSFFVVFHTLVKDSIPFIMDIEANGFVEVHNHVLVVRFKLHTHSLLVE